MQRDEIRKRQREKLRQLLETIEASHPFYRAKLSGSAWRKVGSADSRAPLTSLLDALPLTTKDELEASQAHSPPYGDLLTYPLERYTRLHQTSGTTTGSPLAWLDTQESWSWILDCWDQIFAAVGIETHDRFFFPFSFGPFIGFWAGFEAATRAGHFVLPAGGIRTALRLQLLERHGATVVVCTPTYALHMAEVARAESCDLRNSRVRALIVAGEPGGCIGPTREKIETAWGARCFDHCGMTEIGSFGIEPEHHRGALHVLESDFIVEVLHPDTDRRKASGERGELVITNLGRTASPLIRYRTGDLVEWVDEPYDDAMPYGWLEGGILSRLDDMVIVRGNNIYPAAVERVLRGIDGIAEYRVRVLKRGELTHLVVEIEPDDVCSTPDSRENPGKDAAIPRAIEEDAELQKAPHDTSLPATPQELDAEDRAHSDAAMRLSNRVQRELERKLSFRAEIKTVPRGSLPRFELKGRRWIREDTES